MGRKRKVIRRRLVPTTVEASISYIDTIVIQLPELMEPSCFASLKEKLDNRTHCGRLYIKKIKREDGMWWIALFVHQPKIAALQMLEAMDSPCWITEVHVALDLITDERSDAEALQTYVENRLVRSKRRQQFSYEHLGTTYIDRGVRRGAEVALYSDRPSKFVNGHPCLHIEWRVRGSQARSFT